MPQDPWASETIKKELFKVALFLLTSLISSRIVGNSDSTGEAFVETSVESAEKPDFL